MKLIPKYQNPASTIKYIGGYNPKSNLYVLPVYNDNGTNNIVFPEIKITPLNNTDMTLVMQNRGKVAKEALPYLPGIGDAMDVIDISKDIYNNNYGAAALNVGLMFLPDVLAKSIKRIFKGAKKSKLFNLELVKNWTDLKWDKIYNKAVKNNDKELLQNLRDLHFKVMAPNTKIVDNNGIPIHMYHGTTKKWNEYNRKYFGSSTDNGMYGEGLYSTSHKNYAEVYSTPYSAEDPKGEVKDLYLNILNPFYVETSKQMPIKELVSRRDAAYIFNRPNIDKLKGDIPDNIYREMFNSDGVIEIKGNKRPNFSEVVTPKSSQIKLADPITYDNNGNIIPISKRDNFNLKDIRYGILPFLFLNQYNNEK